MVMKCHVHILLVTCKRKCHFWSSVIYAHPPNIDMPAHTDGRIFSMIETIFLLTYYLTFTVVAGLISGPREELLYERYRS